MNKKTKLEMLEYIVKERDRLEIEGFVPTIDVLIENLENELEAEEDGEGMTASELKNAKEIQESDDYDLRTHHLK